MESYVQPEVCIQYVELAGTVGLFVKLDAMLMDEVSLEGLFQSFESQVRLIVREERKGSFLQKEIYVRSCDRKLRKVGSSQCRYCEQMFHCRADLVAHHHRHHPSMPMKTSKKGRRPCPHCGKLVINMTLHVRTKHEADPLVGFSGMAQCRQCGENYAANTDHASHCRLSPTCPDCNKTFSQWRVMNKHRRIVHMGLKIMCSTCEKTFHDTQSLKKHVEAVHLKLKRMCPICGVTVTALAVHMNAVHTSSKNFTCLDCDKKFKSNYDLSRHRDLVHLGQKPPCPYCGKHLANMRQHIRVVHKQIRFPCHLCKKQMTTKSELKKHFAKSHTEETSSASLEFSTAPGLPEDPEGELAPDDEFQLSAGQKDLSDEQLIAQYLGKQSFNITSTMIKSQDGLAELPNMIHKDDPMLVQVKPELEHLLGGGRPQPSTLAPPLASRLPTAGQQPPTQLYTTNTHHMRHSQTMHQGVKTSLDLDPVMSRSAYQPTHLMHSDSGIHLAPWSLPGSLSQTQDEINRSLQKIKQDL